MKTPRHTHTTHKVSHSHKNSVCPIRLTEPPAPSLYNSTARVSVTSGSLLDFRRAPPYDFHAQFCLPVAGSNFGIGWPVLASNLGANGKVELELEAPEVEATAGCATPMTAGLMAPISIWLCACDVMLGWAGGGGACGLLGVRLKRTRTINKTRRSATPPPTPATMGTVASAAGGGGGGGAGGGGGDGQTAAMFWLHDE